MLPRAVVGLLKVRAQGQGLVEYAAIAAVVTLVGMLGLNILTTAQVQYFNGLPTIGAEPSAPGALLHAVALDVPQCTPQPLPVGKTVTCTGITVRDDSMPVSDRTTPTGTIALTIDDDPTIVLQCTLDSPTRTSNSCSGPLTWTARKSDLLAPDYLLPRDHILTFMFSCPASQLLCGNRATSNHFAGQVSVPLTVVPALRFAQPPSCDKVDVEFGHSITCTATVYENGAPLVNGRLLWDVTDMQGIGTPLLSCATYGQQARFLSTLWDTSPGNPCRPASQLTCVTDSSGTCGMVYRHAWDMTRTTAQTSGIDTLRVTLTSTPGLAPAVFQIPIKYARPPHPVKSLIECTAAGGNVQTMPVAVPLGTAPGNFMIPDFIVKSSTASLTCVPYAVDIEGGSTGQDCTQAAPGLVPRCFGNPDSYTGHPPIGQMDVAVNGTVVLTCTLQIQFRAVVPQAPNQTPFASECPPLSIPVTSSGGARQTIVASFTNGSAGLYPTHKHDLDHTTLVDFVADR